MPVSATSSSSSASSSIDGQQKAFRQADFLKVMLTEITNQSPLDPQETSKLVENMQKLQDLANTTYAKFRADVGWAQDLVGKDVTVQQVNADADELEKLRNKGVNPGTGFSNVNGRMTSFRVVDETVWVGVEGKDYPIDNVKQVLPNARDGAHLAEVAQSLLGRPVTYSKDGGGTSTGLVSGVGYADDGSIVLNVNGEVVKQDSLLRINAN